MDKMGYILFHGMKCVFYEDKNELRLINADKDSPENIIKYHDDRDFELSYSTTSHKHCTAYISKIAMDFDYTLRLFPYYIVKKLNDSAVSKIEIIGDAIDAFFSPSRYFYEKKHKGDKIGNLVYDKETADEWEISFEGVEIRVALSYGGILKRGIASDLMLHPKIEINFPPTYDTKFIYRLYLLVVHFLQIVRAKTAQGLFSISLYNESNSHIGYLLDYTAEQSPYAKQCELDLNYTNYKPFISRFLQFAADNFNMSLRHLPVNYKRINKDDYTAIDYILIYSAFEGECHAEKELYEIADITRIERIRDIIITNIEACKSLSTSQEERDFVADAIQRTKQQGTSFGQKSKIVNAYKILAPALESSIENILYLDKYKGILSNDEIGKIAKELSSLRGKIAHGDFSIELSEEEAQYLRFLEILTYAQLLKRVGCSDKEIEYIIGIVFMCNFEHQKNLT